VPAGHGYSKTPITPRPGAGQNGSGLHQPVRSGFFAQSVWRAKSAPGRSRF